MIYLILAIISSTLVSVCMRFSEKYVQNQMGMFMSNYLICMMLAYCFKSGQGAFLGESAGITVLLGLISGFLYLASFVFLKYNMKHNGIVLASTFMKLGVLIPTIMAITIFREMPRWTQILGIVTALAAIVLINFEKGALQHGNKKIWLLVLLILSGMGDSMANIFEQSADGGKDGYLLLTFFTAFVLTVLLAVRDKQKIQKADVLFGMLIGIPNYFSSRFLLLALANVPAVVVYPTCNVATIVLVTLAGVMVFHEKLERKKAMALVMILAALCLLNI